MTEVRPDDPSSERPVVLVVDDVPTNLSIVSSIVRGLGADVRTALDGPTGLRYARLPPQPDVILLDVMMPDMDGHAVLAELRAQPATRDIPVIFVTALDTPEDEESGLLEGAADFIVKPIKPAVLRARVRAQIELKRARDRQRHQTQWLEQEVNRRLRQSLELATRLQLSLEASGLGIWEREHRTDSFTWSESLSRFLGWERGPLPMEAFLARVHPEDRAAVEGALNGLPGQGDDISPCEYRARHGDGGWRWVEMRGRAISRDSGGNVRTSTGIMALIDARKAAEAQLRVTAAAFAGINEGLCITDANANILTVNAAFTRLTGYSEDEVRGANPRILRSDAHPPGYFHEMWQTLLRADHWQGEVTNRRRDGERITEWLSISAVRDDRGRLTHYIGVFSDLTERKAAEGRIHYLATHDPLTNLPNRNLLADRLTQALKAASRLDRQTAVFLLDLDHFQGINDSLGAPAGDEVLIEVGRRLALQVREGDTVGRRGGNEFGFVMVNIGQEHDVIALARRLLESLAQPILTGGRSVTLTASLGVSLAPRDGHDADTLLRSADVALRRAKHAGRNTFRFYSTDMDADAARRLSLEAALHHALARSEFEIVYQPQVSLETGQLIGMEALLRWQSADFGPVAPREFIPIAEETGLILPIGAWVLRTACLQTRRWLDLGLASLRVAINLSTRQFRQPDLPALVADVLGETGLPPPALELEITESTFIGDVDHAVAQSRALKALGVKLSLDDFGTGHSSLAYLSRFPFDKLKIDQSFVRDITENPVDAAIATSAIVMGRSLNLTVLAEGVETEAQARFLRSRRCDSIQGYLFSHPLPPAQFEQLLAGNHHLPLAEQPDSGPTLLLVDDDRNVLNALTRLLRRDGYQILAATTPQAAFELLAGHAVQVVVSDQHMPGMDGTTFFSRLRQLYPSIIRIVLTAYSDLDVVTNMINQGAIYKFLTKPWDDDQLREQIREAFRLAKDLQRGPGQDGPPETSP